MPTIGWSFDTEDKAKQFIKKESLVMSLKADMNVTMRLWREHYTNHKRIRLKGKKNDL